MIVWGGMSIRLWAQPVDPPSRTLSHASQSQENALVSIHATHVKLATVLKLIENQTGISIVYRDDLIDSVFVSISVENIPFSTALKTLLSGKSIHLEKLSEQQFVLVKDGKESKDSSSILYKGRIRDADTKQPLPGASILLAHSNYGVIANDKGDFQIYSAVSASDTLHLSYVGYKPLILPIRELEAGALNEVIMTASPIQLPDGVVSDTLQQYVTSGVHSGVYSVRPHELFEVPSTTANSPTSALSLLPGIAEGYAGALSIRNGSSSQHLMLLDDIPLYFNVHTFGFSPTVSETFLGTISLFKGGFPATFGGATTGIIELLTRPGNHDRFQASVGLDALKVYSYVNLPIDSLASVQVAFQQSYSQLLESALYRGLLGTSHGQLSAEEEAAISQILPQWFIYSNLQVKSSYNPGPRDMVSLTYHQSKDNVQYEIGSTPDSQELLNDGEFYSSQDNNRVDNRGLAIQWNRRWSTKAFSKFVISGSEIKDTYTSLFSFQAPDDKEESTLLLENTITNLSAHLQQSLQINNNQVLDAGIWYDKKEIGNKEFNGPTSTNENDSQPVDDSYDFDTQAHQLGSTLTYTWSSTKGINAQIGLRQTYDIATHKNYFEPRIFLRHALSDRFSMQGSWGIYRQFLHKSSFLAYLDIGIGLWYLSDDNIKPIQSTNQNLGLTWKTDHYQFNIDAYLNRIDNLLEFQYQSGQESAEGPYDLETEFSNLNGWSRGVEFMVHKQLGRIKGHLAYSISKTERQIDGLNNNRRFLAFQDRTHQGSILSQYKLDKWRIALTWRFNSGRPFTEISETQAEGATENTYFVASNNSKRLPSTHRLDVAMHRTFVLRTMLIEGGITIMNVYNRANVIRRHYDDFSIPLSVTNYVSPGITPTFSIKIIYP